MHSSPTARRTRRARVELTAAARSSGRPNIAPTHPRPLRRGAVEVVVAQTRQQRHARREGRDLLAKLVPDASVADGVREVAEQKRGVYVSVLRRGRQRARHADRRRAVLLPRRRVVVRAAARVPEQSQGEGSRRRRARRRSRRRALRVRHVFETEERATRVKRAAVMMRRHGGRIIVRRFFFFFFFFFFVGKKRERRIRLQDARRREGESRSRRGGVRRAEIIRQLVLDARSRPQRVAEPRDVHEPGVTEPRAVRGRAAQITSRVRLGRRATNANDASPF